MEVASRVRGEVNGVGGRQRPLHRFFLLPGCTNTNAITLQWRSVVEDGQADGLCLGRDVGSGGGRMTGGNLENFSSASEWAGRLDARRFDDDRESMGASKLHGWNLFNYGSEPQRGGVA